MGRVPFWFTSIVTTFLLLCLIRLSAAQIAGCDSPGIDCDFSDDGRGICQDKNLKNGIGSVSFNSNITSDGPLTWTLTMSEQKTGDMPYSDRSFWLGTPSTLNISEVTDFGGCSMKMGILASNLQLPPGFSDFSNYGCGTVMGDNCARDILTFVRRDLVEILQNGTLGENQKTPCDAIRERMKETPLPESCEQPVWKDQSVADHFLFGNTYPIFAKSGVPYQLQDSCQVTTGGPDYLINFGFGLMDIAYGEPDSDAIKLLENGTTPLFTMFYNEPWNNKSTGPVSFLDEPEIHLSCLTIVPSESQTSGSQTSGSVRQRQISSGLGSLWLSLAALLAGLLVV